MNDFIMAIEKVKLRVFSRFDLSHGFHQMNSEKDSSEAAAKKHHSGCYAVSCQLFQTYGVRHQKIKENKACINDMLINFQKFEGHLVQIEQFSSRHAPS